MPPGTRASGQPRRSALLQTRSRDTRHKLIRTALDLWNEHGFDEAFEAITAEEIAKAAGVSKGTFYFHFAHKEDILLEMSWATAELMVEEAQAAMGRGEPTLELAERLMSSLARRVARAPRAAVRRVTNHLWRSSYAGEVPPNPHSFGEAWAMVASYGRDRGELPADIDVEELGALMQGATMDALVAWAATNETGAVLRARLCRRAEVILRGASAATWR